MKKIVWIVMALLLAGVIAAGSFWGGMQYQSAQTERQRANFMNARGLQDASRFQGGNLPQEPGAGGGDRSVGTLGGFSPGTMGWVKSVDGNTLTFSTAQEVKTVQLSANTSIMMTANGTVADLQPGVRVMINGQEEASGQLTASQITILPTNAGPGPAGPLGGAYPAPPTQEP